MAEFPEELWIKILEIGVRDGGLTFRDLCCLSISCRQLDQLSNEEPLWSALLARDFPSQVASASASRSKDVFRIKFKRRKELKLAAHRREVLDVESRIAAGSREIHYANSQLMAETEKLDVALKELKNLKRARQASVALNVWQPEIVRARQKQIVEQHPVPINSRIHALEMEIKLCKQQITRFSRHLETLKQKLDASKEYLASLKYHPLHSFRLTINIDDVKVKQEKMKLQRECSDNKVINPEGMYFDHKVKQKKLKM